MSVCARNLVRDASRSTAVLRQSLRRNGCKSILMRCYSDERAKYAPPKPTVNDDRTEAPMQRWDAKDSRDSRDSRGGSRGFRDTRGGSNKFGGSRDGPRDYGSSRDSRDSRGPRDYGSGDSRDSRGPRDYGSRDSRDSKDSRPQRYVPRDRLESTKQRNYFPEAFKPTNSKGRSSRLEVSEEYISPDDLPPGVFYTRAPAKEIPKEDPNAEWIYGYTAVDAALSAGKRTFYKLYTTQQHNARDAPDSEARVRRIRALAYESDVQMEKVDSSQLDSMSKSRPHKYKFVLECSPLTKIPTLSLGSVNPLKTEFLIQKAQHTDDPDVILNDLPGSISTRDSSRYPLVLLLDEIFDPGNMGNILRSAYYLGVDAIVVGTNSVGMTPVVLKASAGAAEFLPLMETGMTVRFLKESAKNGWKVYAAAAPKQGDKSNVNVGELQNPLSESPCIVVIGNEGKGLREEVIRAAEFRVGIPAPAPKSRLVDSVNVAAATAIICERFVSGAKYGTAKQSVRAEDSEEKLF